MEVSRCIKRKSTNCRKMKACFFAKGSMRKFCRKTGRKTCKGKSQMECAVLPKCLFTKGRSMYCRRRTQKKRRINRKSIKKYLKK